MGVETSNPNKYAGIQEELHWNDLAYAGVHVELNWNALAFLGRTIRILID